MNACSRIEVGSFGTQDVKHYQYALVVFNLSDVMKALDALATAIIPMITKDSFHSMAHHFDQDSKLGNDEARTRLAQMGISARRQVRQLGKM